MRMKKIFLAASLLLAGAVGIAWGQSISYPVLPNVGTSDLVADLPNGSAAVGSRFVHPYQISGALGYQDLGAATTGNTYDFNAGQVNMLMRPSGTLAAVTLLTEATPSDGQMECFFSSQTTTALTWSANTGQTVTGAPTAGVANTRYCMMYEAAASTWYRAQ